MEKEIILKLQGGMGNQMFQYALGRKLQTQLGANLILDTSDFQYDKVGRKFTLSVFQLPNNLIIDDSGRYNFKYDQRKNYIIKAGVKWAPKFLFSICSKLGIYIWEKTDYIELCINNIHTKIFVHGLWQSKEYFMGIENLIKEELNLKKDYKINTKDQYNEIINYNSVAIHLRRSDFLNRKNRNHVLSISYYINAIHYIEKHCKNPVYYVFSDDIQWAKENMINIASKMKFIENEYTDYEEFQLMTACRHYIIANSTFSWWASFIGEKEDSVIIAPEQWYDDGRDIKAIIRDNFIIIQE